MKLVILAMLSLCKLSSSLQVLDSQSPNNWAVCNCTPIESYTPEKLVYECKKGFIPLANGCYHFAVEETNITTAGHYCAAMNSKLVAIETKEELFSIKMQLYKLHQYDNAAYWTSGTDGLSTGEYVWLDSFKPVEVTDWCSTEPNNNRDYHCIQMWNWKGKNCWYKWSCEEVAPSNVPVFPLCEYQVNYINHIE